MTIAIAVFMEAPLPGRCLVELLSAHAPEWVVGLHAAMLRDTIDGLQAIDAASYHVLGPEDAEGRRALERHLPAPWTLSAPPPSAATMIFARSNAPSADIAPIARALTDAGPGVSLTSWALVVRETPDIAVDLPWGSPELASTVRVRCMRVGIPLVELPPAIVIDAPSDVLVLLEELRRYPERAPRTAQFLVTG